MEKEVGKIALDPNTSHLEARAKALEDIKENGDLSVTVFNRAMEKEKEKLLAEYEETYEKAIAKIESLEVERNKLNVGKKSFEKDKKGDLVEKITYDEQTVQKLKKVSEQLNRLVESIDKAMIEGGFKNWQNLKKQV